MPRPRLPRRRGRALVTLLATDVVGSTQKVSELGDAEWQRMLDRHDELIRRHTKRFGGRDLGSAGDGFLLAFGTPVAAVACAAAIRSSLSGIGLQVRAGVHTGECEIRGDQLAGIALHVAARIGAAAGPGQILVSATVKDLLRGSLTAFEPAGTHELRGVSGQWPLFLVRSIDPTITQSAAVSELHRSEHTSTRRAATRWIVVMVLMVAILGISRQLFPARSSEIAVAALDSQSGALALAVREGPMLKLQLQGATGPEDIETIGEFPFLASLTWSDDGCRLAFVAGAEATRAHVFVVGVNEKPVRMTTSVGEYRVIDWAPNGKRVLVSSGGVIGGGLRSIHIVTKESRPSSVAEFKVDTEGVRPSPGCS